METVENLGIVGDVVKVRLGYARNYLLPRQLATVPSEELVKQLQSKRAEAEKHLAEQRAQRQQIIGKLTGFELSLVKSCNDLGVLYGQITQQDIATGLTAAGYPVRPRDVRLSETIKRVGDYEVLVKYETDLETRIKLHVKADRELHKEEKAEMDFDDEGNLITAENPGKVHEIRGIFEQKLPQVELRCIADLPPEVREKYVAEETGLTYAENSLIKARALAKLADGIIISEDSGFEVEALGRAPGIYSARYAPTDKERCEKILAAIQGVPASQRRAQFVACVTLLENGRNPLYFFGRRTGTVAAKRRG
ncbi:MAG TPA: 50S ribosomal protein L9, partial [Phycisphaerales bacterium]|nr:50S ribosomal protein L9 [Phycisphaerales bacterium]